MRTYWDYGNKERAAMEADTVRDLLKFELMDKGIVRPEAPELLPVEQPEVRHVECWTIAYKGKYGSRDKLNISFDTAEQAREFLTLDPHTYDYDYEIGDKYTYATGLVDPEVVGIKLCSEQDVVNVKSKAKEAEKNKRANEQAKEDYNKALREIDNVTESIWEDWHSQRETDARHKKVAAIWDEYLASCENDQEIARRFLLKVYDEEAIAEAEEWTGRTFGAAAEKGDDDAK